MKPDGSSSKSKVDDNEEDLSKLDTIQVTWYWIKALVQNYCNCILQKKTFS